MADLEKLQQQVCSQWQVEYTPFDLSLRLGIASNFSSIELPLNGLRHLPEGDTCGWYLFSGEDFSGADDAFNSMHAYYLEQQCPALLKFLALPPGWRFLITEEYEDVWFDPNLLVCD
jgi:hypothetical protein